MEALTKLGLKSTSVGAASMNEPELRPELILESTTDATEWKLEVERILPQLKVTFKAENKDWRARQEQRFTYKTQIAVSLKDAEAMLTRFHTDIDKSLEKINTRKLNKHGDNLSLGKSQFLFEMIRYLSFELFVFC